MRNPILLSFLLFIVMSCDKEKICRNMPTGNYTGVFTTKNHNSLDNPEMVVSLVNETSVIINGYTFERNECEVTGTFTEMVMFPNQGPVFIKGEIKKKKKKYVLSGSFNLTNTPEESPMYGTFSIEENKYVYSIAISRIAFNIKSSRS